eukprot:scaffold53103_cov44-Tisochrysis_lutea.AAC.1
MYAKTLESDIIDDTSGKEKEFFVGLINVGAGWSGLACTSVYIFGKLDTVGSMHYLTVKLSAKRYNVEAVLVPDNCSSIRERALTTSGYLCALQAPRSHVNVAAAQDEINRDVKELYIA